MYSSTVSLDRPIHIQSFCAISSKRLYQQITSQEHWRTVLVNIKALLPLPPVSPSVSTAL
jgi:hypothetical protein